jgi:serine/threonine protein phosphatase PrpC
MPQQLQRNAQLKHDGLYFTIASELRADQRARVYKAYEKNDPDRELVVFQRVIGPSAEAAFTLWIKCLEKLHSEGKVRLFPEMISHFSEGDNEYLVLGTEGGVLLSDARDRLQDRQCLALVLEQLFLALSKLHQSQFVVCNLNPESCLLNQSGLLQLIDLSCVVPVESDFVGETSPFTSNELIQNGVANVSVDIASIGGVLAWAILEKDFESYEEAASHIKEKKDLGPVLQQMFSRSLCDAVSLFSHVDEIRILVYQWKNELSVFPRPHAAVSSTVGISSHRYINEDSAGYAEVSASYQSRPQHIGFYCLADGMGGHEQGERASQLAVMGALQDFRKLVDTVPIDRIKHNMEGYALGIGKTASNVVASGANQFSEETRMGTTFTGILVVNQTISVAHVGDSRAIRVREGEVEALTLDHSLVASMVRAGQMSEEEAAASNEKNVLLRCIDGRGEKGSTSFDSLAEAGHVEGQLAVEAGDTYILMSDGVWGVLDSKHYCAVVKEGGSAQQLADKIVQLALVNGSDDNASALVISWPEHS